VCKERVEWNEGTEIGKGQKTSFEKGVSGVRTRRKREATRSAVELDSNSLSTVIEVLKIYNTVSNWNKWYKRSRHYV
jgi:hypothetical protein